MWSNQTRQIGRVIKNDQAFATAMRGLEGITYRNNATVRFREVDYSLLSFEEQVRVDLETDVMVGPHGAGLMVSYTLLDKL